MFDVRYTIAWLISNIRNPEPYNSYAIRLPAFEFKPNLESGLFKMKFIMYPARYENADLLCICGC